MTYKTDAELNTYTTTNRLKFKLDDIYNSFNYEYGKKAPESDYLIHSQYGCGAGNWQLKMRYDGTVLYCQNTFYSLNKDTYKDKIGADFDILRFEADHPGF